MRSFLHPAALPGDGHALPLKPTLRRLGGLLHSRAFATVIINVLAWALALATLLHSLSML